MTRYTGILVTTTDAAADQNTKDYIANCIRTVVSAFKFDHQEVFWINGVRRVSFNRNDGKRYYCLALCANYSEADGENASYYEIRRPDFRPGGSWDIRRAMARRDADIENILGTIPAGADRFTQISSLNKWLAEHNQYNTTVKKDGDGPWYAYECISALEGLGGVDGPICSGYASAFKTLCDGLGIPCVTVTGRVAENTGHRWNYVQMEDGKWYAVDVTYNDRNDNGDNLTKWLLVGGKTVVNGKEFLESHPAHNRSYYDGGTDFTNGPVLSDTAYSRGTSPGSDEPPEKPPTNVVLSPQKLSVDGKDIACEKYNIDGSNYFKLRDLAAALNGAGSQFAVGFDAAAATVSITTGAPYEATGTELNTGADNSGTARPSGQAILIDGVRHDELTVYNIGGSNFFQLRELGGVLGFDVGYNPDTFTAIVTSK